jgi:16S rRNA (cytosine1402-N4)-methyltransferase
VSEEAPTPHRRRPRYAGKHPRKFEDKYKELDPSKYPETVAKVLASGKTPAGMHVPIMVQEILGALAPQPGDRVIDCTLGYGGHAREILPLVQPGGRLIGLDVDPIEQPRTEERLRELGFGPEVFTVRRANFASLPRVVAEEGLADCVLADLGVSSMQIDTPDRGFSVKIPGPLDMRMNPAKGRSASEVLARISVADLSALLRENADEPRADLLAAQLAGKHFPLTTDLTSAIRAALSRLPEAEQDKSVRRVFQAIRIAVNEEFAVLDTLLRHLPECLAPGGRVAILTFHSGEDRRVKKSFEAALAEGRYTEISDDVIRAGAEENRANPRATSAKLRWACK